MKRKFRKVNKLFKSYKRNNFNSKERKISKNYCKKTSFCNMGFSQKES